MKGDADRRIGRWWRPLVGPFAGFVRSAAVAVMAAALALMLTGAFAAAEDRNQMEIGVGVPACGVNAGIPYCQEATGNSGTSVSGVGYVDPVVETKGPFYSEAGDGSKIWRQVAGAQFGNHDKPDVQAEEALSLVGAVGPEDSPTYRDNFFDVAFRNPDRGFVGGQRCDDPKPTKEQGCRPVLFSYRYSDATGLEWSKVDLPGGDQPGYAGRIVWLDVRRAVVVGGTGTFPREEPVYKPGPECQVPGDRLAPWGANCDPAGMARVWFYNDGAWCEAKVGEANGFCPALPQDDPSTQRFEGMRGLTAVSFKPNLDPEIGFVGGLGQIWRYTRDRGFDKLVDNYSEPKDLKQPRTQHVFRFRVRDLRFVSQPQTRAYAVTTGCCSPQSGADVSSVLTYSDYQPPGHNEPPLVDQWVINGGSDDPGEPVLAKTEAEAKHRLGLVSLTTSPPASGYPTASAAVSVLATTSSSAPNGAKIWRCQGGAAAALHASGAPWPPSSNSNGPDESDGPGGPVHLLAIDGLTPGEYVPGDANIGCVAGPDWAVGELTSPEADAAGRGRRGLVLAYPTKERKAQDTPCYNDPRGKDAYPGVSLDTNAMLGDLRSSEKVAKYSPTSKEQLDACYRSRRLLVSSYTLNAVDMIEQDNQPSGLGWAVGDHGAILRLGDEGLVKEPPSPPLDTERSRALPSGEPLAALRPAPAARVGQVPGLANRSLEVFGEPRLVGLGSPDATHAPAGQDQVQDVGAIVMSRDGSQGWAVGPHRVIRGGGPRPPDQTDAYGVLSLYRYDGALWTQCHPKRMAGQFEADPACAGLASFLSYRKADGSPGRTQLFAAARVPVEHDANPANDDEFQMVAIGGQYRYGNDPWTVPALARFEDGRWRIDDGLHALLEELRKSYAPDSLELVDVAFTAPNDGWVLARWASNDILLHFDGETWSRCTSLSGLSAAGSCASTRPPVGVTLNGQNLGQILGLEAAGDRVYLYGWRLGPDTRPGSTKTPADQQVTVPLILYRERGKGVWTAGSAPGEDGGGYDPFPDSSKPPPNEQGKVVALSVVQRPDGGYAGWAIGRFFDYVLPADTASDGATNGYWDQYNQSEGANPRLEPTAIAMRLGRRGPQSAWSYFDDPGSLGDFMSPTVQPIQNRRLETTPRLMAALPDGQAFIGQRLSGMLFGFDPGRGRFDVVAGQRPTESSAPSPSGGGPKLGALDGRLQALAPDGRGGFWAAVRNSDEGAWWQGGQTQVSFFHYTDRSYRPVFAEVPQPLGGQPERYTSLSAAADGTVWAGTDSGRLARYERLGGWQAFAIDGWDPGRVVTRRSEVNAVAVDDAGIGVAVGPEGRIADFSPQRVRIDAAAGRRCAAVPVEPCGTGYDLHAAAVAPDGAALVGGDALTVLWRPAGGEFRRVARPIGNPGNRIVAISYPAPDEAWLVTDGGQVYHGRSGPGGWDWGSGAENKNADGDLVGGGVLRALAIDAAGHGYAVGDRGLVLERADGGWKRVRGPGTDNLRSIALGRGGEAAVIGGDNGVIWTRMGEGFAVARPADYVRSADYGIATRAGQDGPLTGRVVGVALVPGVEDGQAEAWAAVEARGDGTNRMLHYTSDPGEPLLDPVGRAVALPDTPARRPGEIAFAAFGNTDCDLRASCFARRGSLNRFEVLGQRIVDELQMRFQEPGSGFALFTGDATFSAGMPASSVYRSDRVGSGVNPYQTQPSTDPYGTPEAALAPVMQREWNRQIADPLERSGLAVFATPGSGDLSRATYNCLPGAACGPVGDDTKTGDNLSWRDAMAVRRAPWGSGAGEASSTGGLSFDPVPGANDHAVMVKQQRARPNGVPSARETTVGGGARTHYAVDVSRDGHVVARVVTVDTSLRSLQSSDAIQQPLETSGQLAWLERMICFEGQQTSRGEACNRKPHQPVIVLTSTPTYSYGATNPAEINTAEGTQLESLLLRYKASVVVSGRLGWNARYWATAPGIHEPCPGGPYQDTPPAAEQQVCSRDETDAATGGVAKGQASAQAAVSGLSKTLQGLGAPPAPRGVDTTTSGLSGILPFVVSAGASGPLGTAATAGQLKASDGYWNGYSIVRVPADGDPAGVVVEQRPIFDWVSITASKHVLLPGQKVALQGVGREPIGYGARVMTRFDELTSSAITHRYHLVEADPSKPYVPKVVEGNGQPHGYVPIDPSVATIDEQSGQVIAQLSNHSRIYALAILSIGDKAATWPLVFEPKRSYVPPLAPRLSIASLSPGRALSLNPASIQPPSSPPPVTTPPPIAAKLVLPGPPSLPSFPTAATPPVAPPAPPAPAPPPGGQQAVPLNLSINPVGISVPPTTGVTAQPTPPVNPSPPGGARKEAKQHQASAAKSEEGGGAEAQQQGGDLAKSPSSPDGLAYTRRDRVKLAADGFTPLDRAHAQPSTWTTGLQWGGGIGLMALALALGFTTLRPTPRGRPPVLPAPAWVRNRYRR